MNDVLARRGYRVDNNRLTAELNKIGCEDCDLAVYPALAVMLTTAYKAGADGVKLSEAISWIREA